MFRWHKAKAPAERGELEGKLILDGKEYAASGVEHCQDADGKHTYIWFERKRFPLPSARFKVTPESLLFNEQTKTYALTVLMRIAHAAPDGSALTETDFAGMGYRPATWYFTPQKRLEDF